MKVLIIFGGRSTEHEVSCVSAASVLNNIKGHDVTKFGITKDGKWYLWEQYLLTGIREPQSADPWA